MTNCRQYNTNLMNNHLQILCSYIHNTASILLYMFLPAVVCSTEGLVRKSAQVLSVEGGSSVQGMCTWYVH